MENDRQVAQASSRSRSRSRKGVNGSGVWLVEESDLDVDAFFMQRNSTFNAQAETGSRPSGRTPGGGVEASSSSSKKSSKRKSSLTFRTPEESSFMTAMSFASLQITECKPSEGEEDISKKAFEQWRSVLESAMKIAGIEEEDAKSNVFKMKAGSKLMDVLEGVPDNGAPDEDQFPYSNAMFKLEQHFSSRDFVLLRRQKLRAMVQGDGESDFVYVKRLVSGAKQCSYGRDMVMEVVADIIQINASNPEVRKAARKLVRKKDSTLSDLLSKIQELDLGKQSEELYNKSHPNIESRAEVAVVARGRQNSSYRPTYSYSNNRPGIRQGPLSNRGRTNFPRGRGGNQKFSRSKRFSTPCWRCTSSFHQPHNCNSIDKVCFNCNVRGHLERACSSKDKNKRDADSESGGPAPKIRKVDAVPVNGKPDDEKSVSDEN